MSSRFWSSLICSTAIVTLVGASAVADDVFMVQLAKPTVGTMATNGSTMSIAADSDIKPLPMIGTAPTAAQPAPLPAPVKAEAPAAIPEAKPEPTPVAAPAEVKPAAVSEPVVKAETPSAAKPEAPAVETVAIPTQPEPTAVTAAPVVSAAAPAADVVAKPVEAAPVPAPATVTAAAAPEPASPVVTVAPAPINPNPVNPPLSTPVNANPVNPAPATPVVAPVTPVVAPTPTVATAPAIPAQPAITQEMIAAAIKAEVDAHFLVGKPADEKKLTAEERKSRAAIVAFYNGRNDQPLWVDAKGLNAHANEAVDRFAHAGEDGLNVSDYPAPSISGEPTAETLGKAEIALTLSAMKYARQAQAGRFDPIRLGELVTEKPPVPDPEGVLKSLAAASNVSDTLEAFNPPHEGYKRLKEKLAEIELGKPLVPQARVPAGPTIRPGEKDTRIALLRNRLGVTGTATADDSAIYDESLVEAVKSFQKTRGLKPSGLIGQQTVDAVNNDAPGADTRAADIIANMERWRWLARDLGQLHVMVNIPDYSLVVVRDGVATHKTKAIVGRVANQTPVFSETMTHIIVNPYWNVPYSIVKKEYLAKAQETNGAALQRGNFEVEVGNRTVDPTSVDWSTVNASEVHLRQRPGEGNALGNIKFMFPNQHSVYIHDTSSRGLFVQSYRSLSHGCVRVQDPFSFADALLAEEPTAINGAKLKSMIGGGEKYLWLKKTIPVHIVYFTDFVDDAGVLQTRPDLYGHNAKTKQLLGL